MPYLANVPIAQLVVQLVVLDFLEGLAKAQPSTAHRLWDISDAAFVCEFLGDVLIRVALLLQRDDAAVIGIVVGHNTLRHRSFTALHTDSLWAFVASG